MRLRVRNRVKLRPVLRDRGRSVSDTARVTAVMTAVMGILAEVGVPVVVGVLMSVGVHATMALFVGLVGETGVGGWNRGVGSAWGGGCTRISECVLVTVGVVRVARCTCGGECTRVACVLVVVYALVPVGTLGAQDFGSRSGRRFVRVRLMVFMDEILPLEGDVQIRPNEPTNIPS